MDEEVGLGRVAAERVVVDERAAASYFAAAVRETENLTMENTAPQFAADASHLAGIGDGSLAAVRSPTRGGTRVQGAQQQSESNLALRNSKA